MMYYAHINASKTCSVKICRADYNHCMYNVDFIEYIFGNTNIYTRNNSMVITDDNEMPILSITSQH